MIRTHLITGFLGVGKTTAIMHLLAQKPAAEKWAVLVNEFGEVGVDGAMIEATGNDQAAAESAGIVVKEIPGGCLCCASGLPFQMGLNLLIAKEKPDVLLIEPTGLGHPRNILATLRSEHYDGILDLGANVCVLDARHLSQPRYREHETFVDQLQLADVLVANKSDLATDADRDQFQQYVAQAQPAKAAAVEVSQGAMDIALLTHKADEQRLAVFPNAHQAERLASVGTGTSDSDALAAPLALNEGEDWRILKNQGQGHFSLGWLMAGHLQFSAQQLRNWLMMLDVERVKGLVNTDEGCLVMNMREGVLSEMPTRPLEESRLEIISSTALDEQALQQAFQACLLS